jgi:hypothetical protein
MPFDLPAAQKQTVRGKTNLSVPKKFNHKRSHERSFDSFCQKCSDLLHTQP